MTIWALLLVTALAAGSGHNLLEQRQAVEAAAAEVARARSEGVRRQEIVRLMARYRELAEALEVLERENATTHDTATVRRTAERQLTEAIARGKQAEQARETLEALIGSLETRLQAVTQAVETVQRLEDPDLKRDILLDIVDQCQALKLVATYDAMAAEKVASEARLRAANLLRKSAPGQGGDIVSAVEAQRLETQAAAAEQRRKEAITLYEETAKIQLRATEQLEPGP